MVLWKQYIILFGGFIDVGIRTNYLSDLWIFDTANLTWKQMENLDKDQCPGPRSGFSFIPCPEGAILHGGYRKEYIKGIRSKGVPLDDTWLLRMDPELSRLKWERRKKAGYPPSLRSGCTMTHWVAKAMGVLFGGVLDEENDEEEMMSVFHNDLFAYSTEGRGRWISLNLKKRKKPGGRRRRREIETVERNDTEEGENGRLPDNGDVDVEMEVDVEQEQDDDDPAKTIPLTRYNAMLAIVKNTLFIYGGLFETVEPAREYTLDDFVTLNLEKLDRYVHLRGTGLDELKEEWKGSDDEAMDSGSEDTGSDSSEDEDEDEDGEELMDENDEDQEEKKRRHAALSQAEKASAIYQCCWSSSLGQSPISSLRLRMIYIISVLHPNTGL